MLTLLQILRFWLYDLWIAVAGAAYSVWDGFWRRVAKKLPPWIVPNHITVGRALVGIVILCLLNAFSAYAEIHIRVTELLVAILGLALIAFVSDALDGALARERDLMSDVGGMLDAIADKIFTVPILVYVVCRKAAGGEIGILIWLIAFVTFEVVHAVAGLYVFTEKLKGRIRISQRPNLPGRMKMVALSTALMASLLSLTAPAVGWVGLSNWMASLQHLLLPSLVLATVLAPISLIIHIAVQEPARPQLVLTETVTPVAESETPASSA